MTFELQSWFSRICLKNGCQSFRFVSVQTPRQNPNRTQKKFQANGRSEISVLPSESFPSFPPLLRYQLGGLAWGALMTTRVSTLISQGERPSLPGGSSVGHRGRHVTPPGRLFSTSKYNPHVCGGSRKKCVTAAGTVGGLLIKGDGEASLSKGL